MIKHVSKFTDVKILEILKKHSKETGQIIIISAYLTRSGLKAIKSIIDFKKVKKIIVGVFTDEAREVFEGLETMSPHIELYVHRFIKGEKSPSSVYFSPILHAKIIVGYKNRTLKWAYTGSANITEFALKNKNIESGVFIHNSTKELDHIENTVKNIFDKKYLIDFKKNRNILLTKDERYKVIYDEQDTDTIPGAFIVLIQDSLGQRPHETIYLYGDRATELLKYRTNEKMLLYFLGDMKLVINKIKLIGEIHSIPQIPISLYIENLSENTYTIVEDYNSRPENNAFITMVKCEFGDIDDKLYSKLISLLGIKESLFKHGPIECIDDSFLKKIVFKKEKSKIELPKNEDAENGVYDLTKIKLVNGRIDTIYDELIKNNHILFTKRHDLIILKS